MRMRGRPVASTDTGAIEPLDVYDAVFGAARWLLQARGCGSVSWKRPLRSDAVRRRSHHERKGVAGCLRLPGFTSCPRRTERNYETKWNKGAVPHASDRDDLAGSARSRHP